MPATHDTIFTPRQNAVLPEGGEIQVRVGIPHTGGALMAEAFNSSYPVMVSTAAFYRNGRLRPPDFMRGGEIFMADVALDSAGFTAMLGWAKKGSQPGIEGIYPWSITEYTSVVAGLAGACSWWSQPDFCCEPAIAADRAERQRRVEMTARTLRQCLQETWIREELARATFDREKDNSRRRRLIIAESIRPPVPVLQGYEVDDYKRSADLLQQAWEPWEKQYGCALIGLGSVCRRHLHDKRHGVLAILRGIEDLVPAGAKLHLFGVKGTALQILSEHPLVVSADSMSYDFQARMSAAKSGTSNSMGERIHHMHEWMGRHRAVQNPQSDLFRS